METGVDKIASPVGEERTGLTGIGIWGARPEAPVGAGMATQASDKKRSEEPVGLACESTRPWRQRVVYDQLQVPY